MSKQEAEWHDKYVEKRNEFIQNAMAHDLSEEQATFLRELNKNAHL